MTTPSPAASDPDPTAPADRAGIFRWPVLALVLLTITAGYTDGYSLSRFDVFIANQSGNIVRAGMGLFGEYDAWPLALLSMLGFGIGAICAWLLGIPAARMGWTLVRVRLLTASAILGIWWLVILLVNDDSQKGIACALLGGMALGVLASVMTKVAGTPIQPTFQTATVLNSARGLIEWMAGHGATESAGRRLAILGIMTIVCYAAGGALGAFAVRVGPTAVFIGLFLPAIALILTRPDTKTPQ